MGRPCSRVRSVWVVALISCSPRTGGPPQQSVDQPGPSDQMVQASPRPRPTDTEWQIVGGRSAGHLTAESSEAELRRHYGDSVRSTRVQLGEGETTPGTVLFPSDSVRRAEIVWQDTVNRSRPARLILRGSRSRWQAGPGVSLGTSLEELERLNGRPFTLAGFGWDYGGVIVDWGGGTLDSSLAGVKLYLDPGPAQYESAPYSQVLGDRDYSSSVPAMRQLNPRVAQIFVDFE
jgi:hypothetical protein